MKHSPLIVSLVSSVLALACLSSCSSTTRLRNYFDNTKQAPSKPSYIALESNTGRVIYAFNANSRRKIGMLTNLATAAVIADWAVSRNIDMCSMMTVPAEALQWNQTGTNLLKLQVGDQISVRDALYSALLWDDSASAITLAYRCGMDIKHSNPIGGFVVQMNQLAARLGMHNTYFEAAHGATASRSTARDLALLSMYVQQKPAIQLITSQEAANCTIVQRTGAVRTVRVSNQNKLLAQNHDVDGLKATRSAESGGCLVASVRRPSIKRPDPKTGKELTYPQNMVIVILGMGDQVRYRAANDFMKNGWSVWENWRATYDTSELNKFIILPKSL
ncbi:MAG: hypothetical protein R3Y56_00515 [Akkermansia sp.]